MMAAVSGIMEELSAQVQRDQESRRDGCGAGRSGPEDDTVEDPELERRMRVAVSGDAERRTTASRGARATSARWR